MNKLLFCMLLLFPLIGRSQPVSFVFHTDKSSVQQSVRSKLFKRADKWFAKSFDTPPPPAVRNEKSFMRRKETEVFRYTSNDSEIQNHREHIVRYDVSVYIDANGYTLDISNFVDNIFSTVTKSEEVPAKYANEDKALRQLEWKELQKKCPPKKSLK